MKGKSLFANESTVVEDIDDDDHDDGSERARGGVPILTKQGYYTVPKIDELRCVDAPGTEPAPAILKHRQSCVG